MIELLSLNHRDLYTVRTVSNIAYTIIERPLTGKIPVPSLEEIITDITNKLARDFIGTIRSKILFPSEVNEIAEFYKDAKLYAQVFACHRESLRIAQSHPFVINDITIPQLSKYIFASREQETNKHFFVYELRLVLIRPTEQT